MQRGSLRGAGYLLAPRLPVHIFSNRPGHAYAFMSPRPDPIAIRCDQFDTITRPLLRPGETVSLFGSSAAQGPTWYVPGGSKRARVLPADPGS